MGDREAASRHSRGAIAAVVVAVVALSGADDHADAGTDGAPAPAGAASVERRDLVDRETVDGTLGYADASPLRAGASGTLTGMRESGDVVRRGESLYDLENEPAAWLLYGSLPAWRDFTPYMEDGEDVRHLERNLRALGCDPSDDRTVDDEWTWACAYGSVSAGSP